MAKSMCTPDHHTPTGDSSLVCCHKVKRTQLYRKSLYAVALTFFFNGTKRPKCGQSKLYEDIRHLAG